MSTSGPLRTALEQEHHEVDDALEGFLAGTTDSDGVGHALTELRRHIYLEEEFLFPPLRLTGMLAPVLVMLREHGEIWRTLDALDRRLSDGATTDDVRDDCTALLALLERHNAKEEPIVYAAADSALDEAARAELEQLLDEAVLPQGWLPQQA